MWNRCTALALFLAASCGIQAQEAHDHGAPKRLGKVSFAISCAAQVQPEFNRGVALLHSFAYSAATSTFEEVSKQDPNCAMAHWGVAMSYFHQLWEPQIAVPAFPAFAKEIEAAEKLKPSDARERGYIEALSLLANDADSVPFSARNQEYEKAMAEVAHANKDDVEAQVFYALSLLSNAPPTDRTHARQKHAIAILEPLDRKYPDHPGITHYLIHACDSSELAPRGLAAARKYARIAPDAPHALHMPSHIFTRLGLWQDSITSNLAASRAAHEQGDVGEELHAMDYLVYAYLQLGRDDDARRVVEHAKQMSGLTASDFKTGYAATAMPVRLAVERQRWDDAAQIQPTPGSPPHVAAIAVWARALGRTREGQVAEVGSDITQLQQYADQLHRAGNEYWAAQVEILSAEVIAWQDQTMGKAPEAEAKMRWAADKEDSMEKLPVTPGPIVPAREQLGELLLKQHRPGEAEAAFRTALVSAPNRRGAMEGLRRASEMASEK